MDRLLVDIHPHIISNDEVRYPKSPLGGVQSQWSKARPATWEALSEAMASAGVGKAAVVQSSTTYGHNNSYLADCVDTEPERITGVCSVGFMEDSILDDIRYWIDERGMSGLRLFTTGSTMAQSDWLNDEKTKPAWAYVAERGIPVCVQLRVEALDRLRSVLDEFPDLRLVLDHVAMIKFVDGPPYTVAEPVYPFADFPGVHLKVTTSTLRSAAESDGGTPAVVDELIRHFGSDRIAWGSNWPASDGKLDDLVALLDTAVAGLNEDDATNICSGTALKLYPKLSTNVDNS